MKPITHQVGENLESKSIKIHTKNINAETSQKNRKKTSPVESEAQWLLQMMINVYQVYISRIVHYYSVWSVEHISSISCQQNMPYSSSAVFIEIWKTTLKFIEPGQSQLSLIMYVLNMFLSYIFVNLSWRKSVLFLNLICDTFFLFLSLSFEQFII